MRIQLRNEIDLGGQLEVIQQELEVEVVDKEAQFYLIFVNDEGEKVVIKCQEEELVMTRFSNPKTIMRFLGGREAIVTIPTPVGLQHFLTDTKQYHLNREQGQIQLCYDLKGLDNQQRFASYKMDITWKQ